MQVARAGSDALSRSYIATLGFLVSTPTAGPALHACVPVVVGLAETDALFERVGGGDSQVHLRRKTLRELDAIPVPGDEDIQAVAAVLLLIGDISTETGLRASRQVEHGSQVLEVQVL